MKRIYLCFLILFLSHPSFVFSQTYCTPTYSGSGNPNTGNPTPFFTHILTVNFADINHSLAAPYGTSVSTIYHDLTNISTKVAPTVTYPLSITVGNGANDQTVAVWIDYNQNKLFESTEMVFSRSDTANIGDHTMHANITIPANATIGKTRMRVGTNYGFNTPNPCKSSGNDWSLDFRDYQLEVVKPDIQEFDTIYTFQNNFDEIVQGSYDNVILGVIIETNASGALSPLKVDSFRFSLIGTTDPKDITKARLFYSGKDPDFRYASHIGNDVSNPSTYFNIKANQNLKPGKNYFWLAYDIKQGALLGNEIDARCNAAFVITKRVPQIVSPGGLRRIGYCVAKGIKNEFVYVRRVSLGNINLFSYYSLSGYTYSNQSTQLERGKNHFITLEAGNSVNDNYTQVWIDFNQDGDFTDAGERVFFDSLVNLSPSNPSYGPMTDSIFIPKSAKIGRTRMRVVSSFKPDTIQRIPDPCTNPVEIGETEDYNVIISEDGEPVADFAVNVACIDSPNYFSDLSYVFGNDSIISWFWDFGDGSSSTLQNPKHKYSKPGVYSAKLTVKSSKPNAQTSITKTVNVNSPKPDFSINQNLVNKPVQFTDESTGGKVMMNEWNFGDPLSGGLNMGVGSNPLHLYKQTGAYRVTLIIMVEGGCFDTLKKFISIDSVISPYAYFAAETLNPYYKKKLVLQDLSVNNPDKWEWTFSPSYVSFHDNTNKNSQNPIISFDSLRTYKVTLKAINGAGSDTFSRIFNTKNYKAPVADFSAKPTSVKAGQLVSFLDQSKNDPIEWDWTFGDNNSSQQQYPLHQYLAKGNYSVTLEAKNPAGKDSKTKTNYIKVSDEYQICETDVPSTPLFRGTIFDSGGPFNNYKNNSDCGFLIEPDCSGPITLKFKSFYFVSGDFIRVYDGEDNTGTPLFSGNGFTGVSNPKDVTAYSGAMYIEEITDGNSTGAGFEAEWSAVPNIKPKFTIQADSVGYIQSPFRLKVNMIYGTGNTFYWDYDDDGIYEDTSNSEGEIIFSTLGKKAIKVKVENCKGSTVGYHIVNIKQPVAKPVANFIADRDTVLPFEPVHFYDRSSNGPSKWKWEFDPQYVFFDQGTNDSSINPIAEFYESGSFNVSLTVSNLVGTGKKVVKKDFIYVIPTAQMCIFPSEHKELSGIMYDPGGDDLNYSDNESCYMLLNPCAKKVTLTFEEFDLAAGDFLRVYDGMDNKGIPLFSGQGFTGNTIPPKLVAQSGAMYLEFNSNATLTGSGWKAFWRSEPSEKPEAKFEGPSTAYTGGAVALFENKSSDNAEKFYWDYLGSYLWNDSSVNGMYKYTNKGNYTVRLIAKNCAGQDTFFKIVKVLDPTKKPVADFVADRVNADINDKITFKDISKEGPNSWLWHFSPNTIAYQDSTDSTDILSVVSFNQTGKYDVSLIASNALGSDTATKKKYINIFHYCDPMVQILDPDIGITRVIVGDIDQSSNSSQTAYEDFTQSSSTSFEIGGRYPFRVERLGNANSVNHKIWIDFNQDGDFSDTGETVVQQNNSMSIVWTDTLHIPKNAKFGPTRMRVGAELGSYKLGPCGPNISGEFEDYRVFIIGDKTSPVIKLIGPNPAYVELGESYKDLGATAFDWVDGNLTSKIVVTKNVDTSTLGTYYVKYNVKDSAGNAAEEVTRTVVVVPDITKPQITLIGPNPQRVIVFEKYIEFGAKAIDNVDGDISANLSIEQKIDTARVDTYEVTYSAYDNAGNYADPVIRTVYVLDTTAPVITIRGDSIAKTKVGVPYIDSGAFATDNYYKNVQVTANSNVNINKEGFYKVKYNAEDLSGNKAKEVSRQVIVGNPASIAEKFSEAKINIFPNPNNGKFNLNVELPEENDIDLKITDMVGHVIQKFQFTKRKIINRVIDLGENASGIYFIKISSSNYFIVEKIEITK